MKINKSLSMIATLTLMAGALAACGSNSNSGSNASPEGSEPAATESASPSASAPASEEASDELAPEDGATLVVWETKEMMARMEEIGKEFTAKYNIPVKVEEVSEADQINKLINDGPAGVGPDIVIYPHDNLGKAVAAGLILPNDYFEEETKAENSEASIKAFTFDGVLYGYPRSVETYAMFYNKDLVQTPAKSYDEIIEFAKTFNDPKNNKYALLFEQNFYYQYSFLATPGGYVYGNGGIDTNDIGLNNDAAIAGAKLYQKLHEIIPMKTADATFDVKKGLFTSGKLAYDINGPWAIADYKKSGVNFGIAPLPTIDGKPNVSFSGVKGFSVSSFSKYPNAAKLFTRFATTKEEQLKDFQELGTLPSNKEAAADPAVTADPLLIGILEQFSNSTPMPAVPQMGNVWTPGQSAMADIWDNNKDPKAALDNAVKQIQDANAATK
ncbi:maltose ABC transporter substrate-binding protein [Cohnella sp. AR92]|uniref:sugar ABC transporter substrate-binding protein n=1 Tax=Cohnella sp. AR92 TaxID=648716 RepID=UPI000F8E1211|nr:maltose ABC transporter substrate-binding protein [Cohnella sp. AR92]RUS46539.1 maltose ABC transporter substrate-binding protein [Cohnella sp. AR92]